MFLIADEDEFMVAREALDGELYEWLAADVYERLWRKVAQGGKPLAEARHWDDDFH